MVFFTCDACGQSIKKNQVEKHYKQQCRNCSSVTCMDCNIVFWGNDYKNHLRCVSENERYGGKNYVPSASSQKGTIKQEKWIEHVKSSVQNKQLNPKLASLMNQLINFNNIPRKQSKFENFARNCLKVRDPKLVSQIWQIFSASQTAAESENNNNSSSKLEEKPVSSDVGSSECDESSGNRKVVAEDFPENLDNATASFKWKKTIKRLLKQHESRTLHIKTLMKRIKLEHKLHAGSELNLSKTDLKGVLMQKLQNSPKFEVIDKMVKLV